MGKNKLTKQIENFSTLASLISPLCSRYNSESVAPFIKGAQIYNENFRSGVEFQKLLQLHKKFMVGSISICNSLFENYEELKQKLVYMWSWHLFNLLNGSKKVLDEVYKLAYTVGRTDENTVSAIEKEKNPLVKVQRYVILDDGEYETYKRSMFDWKCSIQALYVEEQYMKHIVDICNTRESKFNPQKTTACTSSRSIITNDRDYQSTPRLCVLNAELIVLKSKFEIQERDGKLTITDIENYMFAYGHYQRELIAFVFSNFSNLYNETCVQCVKVFLEQQHSIMFNMLEKYRNLKSKMVETITEDKRMGRVAWNDINKETSSSHLNRNCENNTCNNKIQIVGSLN